MRLSLFIPALLLIATAHAQDATIRPVEPSPLRIEIRPAAPLFDVNAPIRVRFVVHNDSDDTVDLPSAACEGGVGLANALIFGDGENFALHVTSENETTAIHGPAAGAGVPLRLAPRAMVGQEIDLRPLAAELRYPGAYRLEWKPAQGRAGIATAEIRIEPRKDVILITDSGRMTLTLNYDTAPQNVANFLDLARSGFYNGKVFSRIVDNWIAQGGNSADGATPMRPDRKTIVAELTAQPVDRGSFCMALRGDDPNSASSQFFIALTRLPEFDGKYTIIGRATDEESLRTLAKLEETPTDREFRPKRAVLIRSMSLVEPDRRVLKALTTQPAESRRP